MEFVALGTIAFLVSYSLCRVLTELPDQWLVHAAPSKRRTHRRPVPLLGGVGIAFGLLVGGLVLPFTSIDPPTAIDGRFLALAILCALVLGVLDDRFELRARWKFSGQNLVTFFLVVSLWKHETPVHQLMGDGILSWAFIWFWSLGTLNSINLIDGMDGLASGIGLLAAGFLLSLTSFSGGTGLLAITVPSILGFYVLNKNPAKIFLGESGAQMVAIVLFIASMTFQSSAPPAVNLIIPFFALGIPILDTLTAMIRRGMRGRGLMSPDREHLHHRMLRMGLSNANAVRFLHGLTLYFCAAGYFLSQQQGNAFLAVSLVLGGLLINFLLMHVAERKIGTILGYLASNLLNGIDGQRPTLGSSKAGSEQLSNSYVARLNLKPVLTFLLERNPSKVEEFYRGLPGALLGIRVEYESSHSALLICESTSSMASNGAQWMLRLGKLLETFEEEKKIDFQLANRNTLTLVREPFLFSPKKKRAA